MQLGHLTRWSLVLAVFVGSLVIGPPSAAPTAEAGARIVSDTRWWGFIPVCAESGAPVVATTTMSNVNPAEGEIVRVTTTLTGFLEKKSLQGPNGSFQHAGAHTVAVGWSGQEITGWGGGESGYQYQNGSSIVFRNDPNGDRPDVNYRFGSTETFWVEFRAPAVGTAQQLPGALVRGSTGDTPLEIFNNSHTSNPCFLLDPNVEAFCDVEQSGPGGSVISFTNESYTPDGPGPVLWTFPDGTTSSADTINKTATVPGPYVATLQVTSGGHVDTETCTATVEPPTPSLGIQLLHDDPADTTGRFEVDEEFDVVVTADASGGVGDITGATLDVTSLFANATNLQILSGPTPTLTNPLTLGSPGPQRQTWRVMATEPGPIRLTASMDAMTDAAGTAVGDVTVERNGRVASGLKIELSFDPNESDLELVENIDDGNARPEPQDVRVTVTITNDSDDPIEGVKLPTELTVLDIDTPETGLPRLANKAGPFVTGGLGAVDIGPFTMAGREVRTVDYVLEARDDGRFTVRAKVDYISGGASIAVGEAPYRIAAGALLGLELINDKPDGFVKGGTTIRVSGYLENLSTTDNVLVDLKTFSAETTGNADPLIVRDLDNAIGSTNCGWVGQELVLEPGERVLIHALIKVNPNGGTRATVEYPIPGGFAATFVNGVPTSVPLTEADVLVSSKTELAFDYSVDTSVELGEWDTLDYAAGLTLGFIGGVGEWAIAGVEGIAFLLQEFVDWENWAAIVEHGPDLIIKATSWYVENWTLRSGGERLLYVKSLADDFAAKMLELGVAAQDVENQRALAEAILPGWFAQVEQAYATNDPFLMGKALGRGIGSVAPEVMTCIPFSPKYVGEFKQLARVEALKQASVLRRAARIAAAGGTGALRQAARRAVGNGGRVSKASSIAWGVGSAAYDAIDEYARTNRLIITLRDRSPGSIKRLTEGFIEKFEAMKLKNVRADIDGPLGYLPEHNDIVAFKKPISHDELADAVAGLDSALANDIRTRHAKRTKEWNEWEDIYEEWKKVGFPSGFQHRPNGGSAANDASRLPFRLKQVKQGEELIPDYFIPEVFLDGAWRGFTGDLDIIDVRHMDGQSLSKPRASTVYEGLRQLDDVNLRHGDTIHWIEDPNLSPVELLRTKVAQLQDYFVGGPDKALQFGPDGARAVQLDPVKTFVLRHADGGVPGRATYAHWDGGVNHWTQVWDGMVLREIDWRQAALALPMFTAPIDWVGDGCRAEMDRADGSIIRETALEAVLETYENGEWTATSVASCSTDGAAELAASARFSAAALTDPVRLPILPQSGLWGPADIGESRIDVHDLPRIAGDSWVGDWFLAGDTVIIDPGTADEETRTIVSIDADGFELDAPLTSSHRRNSMVTLAAQVAMAPPTTTRDTTTPSTTPPASVPNGHLPATGSSATSTLLLGGLAALLAGLLMLAVRRRTRGVPLH